MQSAISVGWYKTAEGGHERYWDGVSWSPAREVQRPAPALELVPEPACSNEQAVVELPAAVLTLVEERPRPIEPVAEQPVVDPNRNGFGQPTHIYRDLPSYAKCPPHVMPTYDEVFLSDQVLSSPVAVRRSRTLFSHTMLAWMLSLWPATATAALVAADLAGWHLRSVDVLMVSLVAAWYALALVDTGLVRRRMRAFGAPRRGGSARLSWWWSLCPPAQLLARTRAAHSTRILSLVMVISLVYPVAWLIPEPMLYGFTDTIMAFVPNS